MASGINLADHVKATDFPALQIDRPSRKSNTTNPFGRLYCQRYACRFLPHPPTIGAIQAAKLWGLNSQRSLRSSQEHECSGSLTDGALAEWVASVKMNSFPFVPEFPHAFEHDDGDEPLIAASPRCEICGSDFRIWVIWPGSSPAPYRRIPHTPLR